MKMRLFTGFLTSVLRGVATTFLLLLLLGMLLGLEEAINYDIFIVQHGLLSREYICVNKHLESPFGIQLATEAEERERRKKFSYHKAHEMGYTDTFICKILRMSSTAIFLKVSHLFFSQVFFLSVRLSNPWQRIACTAMQYYDVQDQGIPFFLGFCF